MDRTTNYAKMCALFQQPTTTTINNAKTKNNPNQHPPTFQYRGARKPSSVASVAATAIDHHHSRRVHQKQQQQPTDDTNCAITIMHVEIQVALNFVISYLYNKLPRRRVNLFGEELEKALKDRFQGHWYPEKPFKVSVAINCE